MAPDIVTETVEYDSPEGHGTVRGLLVRPAAAETPLPAVLVIHENRGLNPYIEDVARRLGKAGYLALAPDGLTSLGGYPGNDEQGREMQGNLDGARLMADFFAGFECLSGARGHRPGRRHRLLPRRRGGHRHRGCLSRAGGRRAVLRSPTRHRGGRGDPGPLPMHYAEFHERANTGWPAFEAALVEQGASYEAHFYPGTEHDTTPRYDPEVAELAWSRTLAFFGTHLGGEQA